MSLVTCALLNTTTPYFVSLKNDKFGDGDDGLKVRGGLDDEVSDQIMVMIMLMVVMIMLMVVMIMLITTRCQR